MNKINIFSTLSVLVFLTACGGDSVAPVGDSQVAEVDVENKTITVRSPSCEITETAAVFNPEGTVSVLNYELSDSALFVIDEYDEKTSYSGNNSSIYGSWTSSGPECTEMNICETLTITETSISNQPDVSRVCAFDVVSGMFMEMGGGIGTEIKKIDCSNGTATMGNTVITVKINEFGPTKQSLKVSTDSGSCSLETEIKPLTAALCTVANADKINEDTYVSGNDEEFVPCFIGLTLGGFDMDFETSDDGFAKASSKVKAFSKALSTLK